MQLYISHTLCAIKKANKNIQQLTMSVQYETILSLFLKNIKQNHVIY